jgi:hypothetical protein
LETPLVIRRKKFKVRIKKINGGCSAYIDAFPKQHGIIFKEPNLDECLQKMPVEI